MPAARASPSHASRVGAVGRHHAVLPHDLPDPAGPCLQHAPRAGLAWLSLQCTTGRTPRGHVLTAASRASRSDSSPGQNCGGQGAREQPSSEEEPMGTGLGAALPLHRALRCACRAARQPTGAPGPPPGQSPRSVTDQAGEQTEARLARAATGQQAVAAGFSPALPTRWWWKSNTRGTPQRECRNSRSCRLKADATSSFSTAGGGGVGGAWHRGYLLLGLWLGTGRFSQPCTARSACHAGRTKHAARAAAQSVDAAHRARGRAPAASAHLPGIGIGGTPLPGGRAHPRSSRHASCPRVPHP